MREIADPQTVGRRGCEVTVDEVPRPLGLPVRDCRAPLLASDRALKAGLLHQAFDGAAGDVDAFAAQRPPHLAHAIDAEVLGVNLADALDQLGVALSLSAGIAPASLDLVIGGWGDLERLADRLDPVLVAKGIDHRAHLLGCGSSSRAKKAEALSIRQRDTRSFRRSRREELRWRERAGCIRPASGESCGSAGEEASRSARLAGRWTVLPARSSRR